MNVHDATQEYEKWKGERIALVRPDLDFKHDQMRSNPFAFLRATFYRWIQGFPKVCADTYDAPRVLSVGDLHVENFGTWRDAEGRLIWGVNDFDEAAWLPYVQDLIRLASSVQIAVRANHLKLDLKQACDAISDGYRSQLERQGRGYVLAEDNVWLRHLATGELRNAVDFWAKIAELPTLAEPSLQSGKTALVKALPHDDLAFELKSRRAGLGSLGHPRYVAVADWDGGKIAREAKALAPSAAYWTRVSEGPEEILYPSIVHGAARSPDPFLALRGIWIVRRLAPDCTRIELDMLPESRDEARLVEAMGRETANVHLGSKPHVEAVLKHLSEQPKKWLHRACEAMTERVLQDFEKYARG